MHTTALHFGIALYSPLREGEGRHWALVVGRKGDPSLDGSIRVYQIVHKRDGTGYELMNKDKAQLSKSSRYFGLVDLGILKGLEDERVINVIKEQLPEQGEYKLPEGKRWSCAWWVIRSLRKLKEKGGVTIPGLPESDLELYNKVVGSLSGKMPNAAAPLRAVAFN